MLFRLLVFDVFMAYENSRWAMTNVCFFPLNKMIAFVFLVRILHKTIACVWEFTPSLCFIRKNQNSKSNRIKKKTPTFQKQLLFRLIKALSLLDSILEDYKN